jgi:hypothetical protein
MYLPSSYVSLSCTNTTKKQYQAIKDEVYSIRREETTSRTRMKINKMRRWVKQGAKVHIVHTLLVRPGLQIRVYPDAWRHNIRRYSVSYWQTTIMSYNTKAYGGIKAGLGFYLFLT